MQSSCGCCGQRVWRSSYVHVDLKRGFGNNLLRVDADDCRHVSARANRPRHQMRAELSVGRHGIDISSSSIRSQHIAACTSICHERDARVVCCLDSGGGSISRRCRGGGGRHGCKNECRGRGRDERAARKVEERRRRGKDSRAGGRGQQECGRDDTFAVGRARGNIEIPIFSQLRDISRCAKNNYGVA